MRVLVCGGRDYKDRDYLVGVLDGLHAVQPITMLMHGAAPGADTLASHWAWLRGVPETAYPADWKAYGTNAGPIRNRLMAKAEPRLVVAFPGKKGTTNMKDVARAHGIQVLEFQSSDRRG